MRKLLGIPNKLSGKKFGTYIYTFPNFQTYISIEIYLNIVSNTFIKVLNFIAKLLYKNMLLGATNFLYSIGFKKNQIFHLTSSFLEICFSSFKVTGMNQGFDLKKWKI